MTSNWKSIIDPSRVRQLARSGSVDELRQLCHDGEESASIKRYLSRLTDRKQRTLLHLACKSGRQAMIEFLLTINCSIGAIDRNGDTPAHTLLHAQLKASSRKRGNRSGSHSSSCYSKSCRLLSVMAEKNPDVFHLVNDKHVKPSDLLRKLRGRANDSDKSLGDSILSSTIVSIDSSKSTNTPRASTSKKIDDSIAYDDHWVEVGDEFDDSHYAWADYFVNFVDPEFNPATQSAYKFAHSSRPKPCTSSSSSQSTESSNLDSERADFLNRHKTALEKHNLLHVPNQPTYDEYLTKWNLFASSSSSIKCLADVVWPPFCQLGSTNLTPIERIRQVLDFTGHSVSQLRQLQVSWHPDKFQSRFTSRLAPAATNDQAASVGVKESEDRRQIIQRVVALSQLLNTAMDHLRKQSTKSS